METGVRLHRVVVRCTGLRPAMAARECAGGVWMEPLWQVEHTGNSGQSVSTDSREGNVTGVIVDSK